MFSHSKETDASIGIIAASSSLPYKKRVAGLFIVFYKLNILLTSSLFS